jgi:peptidyl-prolyl cis-trans isomerase SurA
MSKTIFTLLLTLSALHFLVAQEKTDAILMTIGDKAITQSEFERIYTKNNQSPAFDKASLDEYMELFINFKLKVLEAEALQMDTIPSFISELEGYKRQLEKPYFTDEDADEELMKEAYERMQWNVRASHILIKCDENALPADTLKAYKKIEKIRKQALMGEDFGTLATKNSEDPSVAKNQGDLGYFTAFNMVYPFESGAYNTKVGEISQIVRSRFGYHIIKVVDKKADQGQIKVAHLMRAVPQGSSIEKEQMEKDKIYQLYDSIQTGANFETLVRSYSDDRGTSKKGGELPYFGKGRMIPEFENVAFGIEEIGQIAEPVKTAYGWHIIKLLDKKPLGSYEEMKPTIKNKISKDIRAQRGKEMVMNRLKKEYKFKVYDNALTPFYQLIDSSIYMGQWKGANAQGLNNLLFTLCDTIRYTQADFAKLLSNDGLRRVKKPIQAIVNEEFNRFVDAKLRQLETTMLPIKYPEFKYLLQEYHDGILLFNLTDKMVWSKAVEDTIGLEKFYQQNKQNYMWSDRVEASIYTYNNANYEKSLRKLAVKTGKKNLSVSDARATFMKKVSAKDSTFTLMVVKNKFSKGDNELIDAVEWTPGSITNNENNGKFNLVFINQKIAPEPKKLNEARGLITADYQNYLEKLWLTQLREKYAININKDVFNGMIK